MLDIQVSIESHKVIIEGLNQLAGEFPQAIRTALERSAKGIHREAYAFLSGAGAKGVSKEVTSKRTGKTYLKWEKREVAAGGYPVPVRTGWLRRMLDWLKPGESKTNDAGTFIAGPNEVVIYDSAIYANVIHEGRGSSAKFGPRRYITAGFERFNQGARIVSTIEEEIQKAKGRAGL